MNYTVAGLVDMLFEDVVSTEETRAMHEELMNNCQEHYQDLINRGLNETEAIDAVVESLKGMKDVINEYPKKGEEPPAPAPEPAAPAQPEEPKAEEAAEPEEAEEAIPSWHFPDVNSLQVNVSDQDLTLSISPDDDVHIFCADGESILCDYRAGALRIHSVERSKRAAKSIDFMSKNEPVTLNSMLSMVGKVLKSISDNFIVGAPIEIQVPKTQLEEIEINTRSGEIHWECVFPDRVTARSTSGEIVLTPSWDVTTDKLLVSSVSGDVEVHGSAVDAEVISMSGDVQANGAFENLRLRSTSGDTSFRGGVIQLTCTTISGDVEARVENTSAERIDARSTSGDVEILLPADMPGVHAEISTVSGSRQCSVPIAEHNATLNILAKSVSGDVRIR